ncbi:hypothetical protein BBK36DRAFT_4754 [Trichoderma citrinoviride]|uniref:Nudix hydrolase domain-containing protein n=1 Tax=Trichoderma citrinoviride TaxID=58853 RepID=A0A2T4BB44_9HYPO|nr:hypothetical protein BBK36DRAFT_4754 [Trichoderma citrinoviride]PTB66508.1 hypothetical protein BBK36DRAFT_4754 [Trichoderma citrinoviride]
MAPPPYTYTHSPSLSPLSTQPPQSLSTTSNPPIAHLMTSVLILRQPKSQSQKDSSSSSSQSTTTKASPPPPAEILLLRRSPTDSYPLKWETPGGSVDPSDPSVLAAAARELYEEARLADPHFLAHVGMAPSINADEAARMGEWGIPPDLEDAKDVDLVAAAGSIEMKVTTFMESGEVWGKMNFLATVDEEAGERVVTDPEEHLEWGWFTEDEVRRGRAWRRVDGVDDGERREKVLEFTSQAVWGSILESFRVGRELGVIV